MWPFRPNLLKDKSETSGRLSTADYLCRLMEEQNGLLRELLFAMGKQPHTLKTRPSIRTTPRTDADVFRVGREDVLTTERKAAEAIVAPWRRPESGPGSAQTPTNGGSEPTDAATARASEPLLTSATSPLDPRIPIPPFLTPSGSGNPAHGSWPPKR